jgi:hypothetical protein
MPLRVYCTRAASARSSPSMFGSLPAPVHAATDEAVPNLLAHIVSEAVTKISEALHRYRFVETLISQYSVS